MVILIHTPPRWDKRFYGKAMFGNFNEGKRTTVPKTKTQRHKEEGGGKEHID
jgi:hypothetical protein